MRKTRFGAACTLGILAAALCAQSFRERVDVDLVRVELLALDSKGRPVAGLKAGDFTIRVDGRPVRAESFEEPRPTAARPSLPSAGPTLRTTEVDGPAAPPATPPPTAPAPSPHTFIAVLVDETSSEQSNRQATLREVFRFLQTSLPPDIEAQLMRFDGKLRVECPWTSDGERLRRCVSTIVDHRYAPRLAPPGQANDPGLGTSLLQLDAMEAVGHVRTSLGGLFEALWLFPEKPGRKAIYFVSDGAPFLAPSEVAKDLIATSATQYNSPLDPPRTRAEAAYDRDLLLDSLAWNRQRSASLLMDITRQALVRDIEIHPVVSAAHDASTNVRTDRSFSSRANPRGGRSLDPSSTRSTSALATTDMAAATSMEAVAEATGGEAVLSRRSFEDGLKHEVDTRDAAYALAFRDPFSGDHRFHKIEIDCAKAGLNLRYRRGYRILDVRESLIQGTVNRLYIPADQNDLGVRLRIDSLGVEDQRAVAQITIAYPAPPEAGGKARAGSAVQIIGTCAVRDGKLSEPIDLSGPTETLTIGEEPFRMRAGRLNIQPGSYRFCFAIRDEQTGITSYLTFDRRLP
jgi:VWFA-related protein